MSVPSQAVPVPASVARLASGGSVVPVWRNEAGGLTFRVDDDGGAPRHYVKWNPPTSRLDLAAESERLAWAAPYTTVPEVVEHTWDDDGAQILVTAAVPGLSAVAPRWVADPATAAHALGAGLRALHDALPLETCPFDWGVDERLSRLPNDTDSQVRMALADRPDVDRLVVCHGDACAPNTLLDDAGRPVAHVDLGRLGVADRWADLAVCAWSTEWNYGPGYDHHVYEAYGVLPDTARIAYYRLLWDNT